MENLQEKQLNLSATVVAPERRINSVNCNKLTCSLLEQLHKSNKHYRHLASSSSFYLPSLILSALFSSTPLTSLASQIMPAKFRFASLFVLVLLLFSRSEAKPNNLPDGSIALKTIDGQITNLETIMETTTAAHDYSQQQQQQYSSSSSATDESSDDKHSLIGNACAAPEVLVNGSPSPDIAGTVSGGDFSSIEEIQFVGIVNAGRDASKQKRICKIKCLNGVWIGPLCALENGKHIEDSVAEPGVQLSHGSIIAVHCNEVGLFKLIGGDNELHCVDGLWDKALPYCQPTTIHHNFSQSSPPTILYTPIDGTLGVDERGRVIVSPGAMVHLDCLFNKNLGQPRWNVSQLDEMQQSSNRMDEPTMDDGNEPHHHHHHSHHRSHHSHHQHNSSLYDSVKHKKEKRKRAIQLETLRSATMLEEYLPESEYSLRNLHRTGWAMLSDSVAWKYRLAIYYASHKDTGRYVCTTPNEQSNCIDIIVKDVKCPMIMVDDDSNRVMSVEGNRMHDRARFSCLAGYRLIGQFETRCMPNGQWSHSIPSCERIHCPDIAHQQLDPKLFYASSDVQEQSGAIAIGTTTASSVFGSMITFRCPTGYRLKGESTIHCTHKSQWSHPFPTCEQITCPEPNNIEHGQLMNKISRYLIGDYVQYVCNVSHRMVNDPIIRCLENGTWSGPLPRCKPACTYPGNIANGTIEPIKFYYDFGELIRVICEPGYRLHHAYHHHWSNPLQQQQHPIESMKGHLICDRQGKWNRPTPECRLALIA